MQLYKTKKLIENGVNFNAIYNEKQEKVKEITGFTFSMSNIVNFLKEQTKNFTIQNSVAFDVDAQIYSIYTKWELEQGNKQKPKQEEPNQEEPKEEGQDSTDEKPSKEVLQTRLKLVKKMNDKTPSTLLKTRIKIIEKQLKES